MTRIYPNEHGHLAFMPSSYGQDAQGDWWICTPTGFAGVLTAHTVEEHEDGTITVRPSILTPPGIPTDASLYYHGFLTRGVWTPA